MTFCVPYPKDQSSPCPTAFVVYMYGPHKLFQEGKRRFRSLPIKRSQVIHIVIVFIRSITKHLSNVYIDECCSSVLYVCTSEDNRKTPFRPDIPMRSRFSPSTPQSQQEVEIRLRTWVNIVRKTAHRTDLTSLFPVDHFFKLLDMMNDEDDDRKRGLELSVAP